MENDNAKQFTYVHWTIASYPPVFIHRLKKWRNPVNCEDFVKVKEVLEQILNTTLFWLTLKSKV